MQGAREKNTGVRIHVGDGGGKAAVPMWWRKKRETGVLIQRIRDGIGTEKSMHFHRIGGGCRGGTTKPRPCAA